MKDQEADFALRLCNGFPLSKEQRNAFRKFVEWATEQLCRWYNQEGKSSPCIKAALRFFLSWPDIDLRELICWKNGDEAYLWISSSMDSWHFTFGQLMKEYLGKNNIDLWDEFFEKKQTKGTNEIIGKNTYKKIVEAWVEKNDSLRNAANRKGLKERFKMFLKSLKGFTDWDTEGGTIKNWEDYQLKRWEAYKDLTKRDEGLPKSLTTRKAIRDAEKK